MEVEYKGFHCNLKIIKNASIKTKQTSHQPRRSPWRTSAVRTGRRCRRPEPCWGAAWARWADPAAVVGDEWARRGRGRTRWLVHWWLARPPAAAEALLVTLPHLSRPIAAPCTPSVPSPIPDLALQSTAPHWTLRWCPIKKSGNVTSLTTKEPEKSIYNWREISFQILTKSLLFNTVWATSVATISHYKHP